MPNWKDNYWTAFKAVLRSAWPDMPPGNVFRDNVIERVDWTQRMNDGELVVPWCVVRLEFVPTMDWGVGAKYEIKASVFYITSLEASSAVGVNISDFIESKLMDLQQALYVDQTLGTTLDQIEFDTGSENPVNVSFLGAKLPMQGGSLTCTTIAVAQ